MKDSATGDYTKYSGWRYDSHKAAGTGDFNWRGCKYEADDDRSSSHRMGLPESIAESGELDGH